MTPRARSLLWVLGFLLLLAGIAAPAVTLASGGWLTRSTIVDYAGGPTPGGGSAEAWTADVDVNGWVVIPSALALMTGIALGVIAGVYPRE